MTSAQTAAFCSGLLTTMGLGLLFFQFVIGVMRRIRNAGTLT